MAGDGEVFHTPIKRRGAGFSGASWCHHSHGSRPCSPPCARRPPLSLRPWAASCWLVSATGASLSVTSRVRQRAPGRRGPAVRVLSRAVCAVGPRRSPRCGHPAKLARVAALALRLRARIAAQRPKRRRVRVRAVPCPPMRRATSPAESTARRQRARPAVRCSRGSPAHVPAPPGCSLRRTGHRRPLEPPLSASTARSPSRALRVQQTTAARRVWLWPAARSTHAHRNYPPQRTPID